MISLLDEAWRLEPFVPPFRFSAFFSPEDTLLCVCAADSARRQLRQPNGRSEMDLRVAELTSGSGLVGLRLLSEDARATLLGLDIDEEAVEVSAQNSETLGLSDRSRFVHSDIWSEGTLRLLESEQPHLLVCNPPYVPEPPGMSIQLEAGAGAHGTAHLVRTLELARLVQPNALALSWCSLSDPASIVAAAEDCGYELTDLFVTAIADGEYSGSVHSYLRDLDNCFISEQRETLAILAPDGAARFAYLLFAGAFLRGKGEEGRGTGEEGSERQAVVKPDASRAADIIRAMCEDFSRDGFYSTALFPLPSSVFPRVRRYILSRHDELQLRVMLHGALT